MYLKIENDKIEVACDAAQWQEVNKFLLAIGVIRAEPKLVRCVPQPGWENPNTIGAIKVTRAAVAGMSLKDAAEIVREGKPAILPADLDLSPYGYRLEPV